jgi:hypothetical protein
MKNLKLGKFLMLLIGALFLFVEWSFASVGIQSRINFNPNQTIQLSGISQEIWVDYIIGNLFKDNQFLDFCFDESEYVLGGSVVHIPQAGAKPTIVKNRSSYPATAVRRTDTDITYTLDEYSSDPTHIPNADAVQLSYSKMDSVLGEHVSALGENYADDILFKWAPTTASCQLRTTGALVATALSPSATGTRRKLLKEDLQAAQALMDKQKISKKERYCLIPTDMGSELKSDADLKGRDFGGELNLKDGFVGKLYGFTIMERSDTIVYDNSGTPVPKAPGAAGAASDNNSVICWQKNAVAKAKGSIGFFENLKDALYYGDVYSAAIRLGGRKRRTAGEGVIAIIQTAV